MKVKRQVTLRHLLIENQKMIGLQFYPDKIIQLLVKSLPNIGWSKKFNMVCLPNTKVHLDTLFKAFKGIAYINGKYFFLDKPLYKGNDVLSVDSFRKRVLVNGYNAVPEEFLQKLELRGYSINTAKTYICMFERFLNYFNDIDHPMLINEKQVNKYLQSLVIENKSDSFINQSINAVKFYYEIVEGMPNRYYNIDRPKKSEKLPDVLSKEEVKRMISITKNIKHRCIISLLYSAGLRRGELIMFLTALIVGLVL